jgi:hypothetical protein
VNVNAGKAGFISPCPNTDAKTAAKLAQAEQKKVAAICEAWVAYGKQRLPARPQYGC